MNFYFWSTMLVMLLLAITILVFPLIKPRQVPSYAYRESNLRLHAEKIKELDLDLAEGRIDQTHYKIARQELDRELLGDIPVESKNTAALHYGVESRKQPVIALSIAVFVPTLAFLVYMQLGMHASSERLSVENRQQEKSLASAEDMTTRLEQHLQSEGGKVEEWAMLGRAYKHLGRYEEAANAFATAVASEPKAQLMLEQAEALALNNGNRFDTKARELVLDALGLEPDNVNALWFAGVVEYQFGNYQRSLDYLSRLSAEAAIDEEINKSLRFYMTKAREQLVAAGEKVPAIEEMMQVDLAAGDINTEVDSKSVVELQVQVNVIDEVRQRFSANDTVFVYAKAVKGPKMPLAVQRISLAQLPTTVLLDDNMAMVKGMSISAFPSVIVSARISKSGSAIAQSGDYIGQTAIADTSSSRKLDITIDTLVP